MTETEQYDHAMRITSQEEADAYFEKLVSERMGEPLWGDRRQTAQMIERENLGYWAGYGSLETRARVERLFKAFHPLLPPTDKPQPHIFELMRLGWKYAREHSDGVFPWPRREGPFE